MEFIFKPLNSIVIINFMTPENLEKCTTMY
jgi:hypothetical protein